MGIVRAVCTSPAKGTQKTNVKSAEFIEDFGIKEDAHAGKWHRQISFLTYQEDLRLSADYLPVPA